MHCWVRSTRTKKQWVDHHVVDRWIECRARVQSLPVTCRQTTFAGWEMLYNWCCFRLRPNIFVHLCHYAGPLVIARNSIGGLRTTTGSCLFSLLLDVPRDLRLVSYSMHFKCAMYTRYRMLHVEGQGC